ncbi:MAG: hypothetical protein GEV12_04015 [Micromonosporaceae bacterium]|nr:hypothetical protein [Micromonosporaceae bacterium]
MADGRESRTRLHQGTWAETESYLERPFPTTTGPDPVELGSIRRRLEVLEWDCPLHTDRAAAVRHGYGDVIAPATMLGTYAMPAYWQPGDPPLYQQQTAKLPPLYLENIPAPGERMSATDWSIHVYRYLEVNDRVSSTTRLVDINRKRTRLGDGAFLTIETVYTDHRGGPVGRTRLTVFRF